MSAAQQIGLFAVPLATTASVFVLINRLRIFSPVRAWAPPLALACGLVAGYLLIFPEMLAVPKRHSSWLPIASIAAALISCAFVGLRRLAIFRWLLIAAACLATAYFVVPRWETLYPPRSISIACLATYLVVLTA